MRLRARAELDQGLDTGLPRQSFGELLGQLANNSAALVRDEIELARQEVSEKIVALRLGMIIVAAGSLISLVAILTLTAAAVIALSTYVGPGYAALIVGAMLSSHCNHPRFDRAHLRVRAGSAGFSTASGEAGIFIIASIPTTFYRRSGFLLQQPKQSLLCFMKPGAPMIHKVLVSSIELINDLTALKAVDDLRRDIR